MAFFIDKLEKHELLEVDESLKKNCGIDIDMIVQKHHKDAPLTERVTRDRPSKEDLGPNSQRNDPELKRSDIKDKCSEISFNSSFFNNSIDSRNSFLKNEL